MQINILITGDQLDSASGRSALNFCRASVARGHTISQVFFYQAGVAQASRLALPLADELNLHQEWHDFSRNSGTPLVVCVSAAERRGVINAQQAQDNKLGQHNLGERFAVEGLGSFHAACLEADRTVTFT